MVEGQGRRGLLVSKGWIQAVALVVLVNVWKVVGSVSLLLQGCPSLGSALAPTPRCSLTLSPSPRCSHSSHSGRPPPPSSSSSPPERAAPACSSCVSWRGEILGR